MAQETLTVKGMSCGHCVSSVEGSVGELSGVESVKVALDKGQVEVSYNENELNLGTIKEVIEDQGYDVVS
ncbi:copper chaperone CopZ [Alkalihalophilus pseudofirmus]|uniref:copper chaperone CopZ n=1 Tax=Alkalihalophilus pseudofirmus TaxID=79885 RepID=UPI00259B8CF2|nr:copper chaperone CopZ [Alkalihalophilus pseudofirmus]WEG15226.1 copper chaperone CopZ [Alkalihalophilus pseudofirmus]